jgi:hypothetical protein
MRVHVEFFVRHNEDLRLCREVFLEIAACDPRILPHPAPHFRVAEIGKDGVKISCRPYVLKDDFWGVTFDLKAQLKWAYQRYGIQFQISRLEVEMTPLVEPSSIPPTAAPSRAGSFDSEFDDDSDAEQACLAKVTLDEKMSRRNALPSLSRRGRRRARRRRRRPDEPLDAEPPFSETRAAARSTTARRPTTSATSTTTRRRRAPRATASPR